MHTNLNIYTNNELVKIIFNGYSQSVAANSSMVIATNLESKYLPDNNVYSFYHVDSTNKVAMRPDGGIELKTGSTGGTSILRCVLTYPMKN